MSDAWHIPRASLGGSTSGSSNSSNKSHSNPPTVTRYSRQLRQDGHTNLAYIHNEKTSRNKKKDNNKRDDHNTRYHNYYQSSRTSSAGLSNHSNNSENVGGIKRSSRSSQGSTDSNSSTHSASSGSMLLTAANLERFVAIHNKQQQNIDGKFINNDDPIIRQLFNTNPEISLNPGDTDDIKSPDHGDTVIGIDPNLLFVKTKDVDAVSIASSTHFTMVNGIGGPQKKIKEGICSRGHQITVLILSMSMFFLVGILAMVYLLEMRAREMPQ